ncbi:glycosyltransferase [Christensenellaceae bacterium OttesenSCG-928-M15]|nr:glycosyltransferase [Christensenellaceae bacterium OttesenSCG-928-M15]
MPVRNAKGGITQYVLRNWSMMDKSKVLFDWVTLDKELSFEQELLQQGCRVHHLSCRQEDDEQQFCKEMRAILRNGYDVVHLHTSFWRGFLAEELAKECGISKIVVHAHSTGIDNPDSSKRKELLQSHEGWKRKFHTGLATHFAACSESAAAFLFGEQIPKERIQVLKNGIDTRWFEYREGVREATRDQLDVANKFVLLQSGRLEYQKNYAFTLDVFEDYSKRNPDAVLLIVGNGSLEYTLKERAHPLRDKIKFLGFRSDIPELLNAADVFLQPSHFEGFSIASVEAQCSGITWLVSEAVPEAALPQHRVELPLNKVAWVDALKQIENNPHRNKSAQEQLRELGWDIRDSAKSLEGLYE